MSMSSESVIHIRRTIPPGTYKKPAGCPDKTRLRGYSMEDPACAACQDPARTECMSKTLTRLMAISDDLNRKLGFELDTDGWCYQGSLERVTDQFDGWRNDIECWLSKWARENDARYVTDKLKTLHGATLFFLDRTWPEWRKWAKQFIDNVHVTTDDNVDKLKWSLRIPYYIMDVYMRELSGNSWKVFSYIARRVTFDPTSPRYGRVSLGYDEIKERTGVLQPERCIKELVKRELLKVVHIRRASNGEIGTTNEFTVTWFGRFKKLGVAGYGG